jgi:hypothetical protein
MKRSSGLTISELKIIGPAAVAHASSLDQTYELGEEENIASAPRGLKATFEAEGLLPKRASADEKMTAHLSKLKA